MRAGFESLAAYVTITIDLDYIFMWIGKFVCVSLVVGPVLYFAFLVSAFTGQPWIGIRDLLYRLKPRRKKGG